MNLRSIAATAAVTAPRKMHSLMIVKEEEDEE